MFSDEAKANAAAKWYTTLVSAKAKGLQLSDYYTDTSGADTSRLFKDAKGGLFESAGVEFTGLQAFSPLNIGNDKNKVFAFVEHQMDSGKVVQETGVWFTENIGDTSNPTIIRAEMDRGTLVDIKKEIDPTKGFIIQHVLDDRGNILEDGILVYFDEHGNKIMRNFGLWVDSENDGKFSGTKTKTTESEITVNFDKDSNAIPQGEDTKGSTPKTLTLQLRELETVKDDGTRAFYSESFNPSDQTVSGTGYGADGSIQYITLKVPTSTGYQEATMGRDGNLYDIQADGTFQKLDREVYEAERSSNSKIFEAKDGEKTRNLIEEKRVKELSKESFGNWRIALGQFQGFSGFTQFLPDGFVEDWREFLDKTYISKLLKRDYYASLICDAWLPSPGRDQNVVTLTSSSGAKEVIGGFPAGERSQVTYPNGSIDYTYKLTYAVRNPEGSGRKEIRFNVYITKAGQRYYLYRNFIPVKEGKKFIRGFVAGTDGTEKDYLRGPVIGTSRHIFDQICLEFNPKVTIVGKDGDDEDVGNICNDIGTYTGPASAFDETFGTSVAPGASGSGGELSFDEAFPG